MIEDWIKQMWYMCTTAYYSAIRKDEILPFTTTRKNLENIMLSQINQTEKNKNHDFTHMCDIKLKATNEETNSQTPTTAWWLQEGKGLQGTRRVKEI